MKTANLKPGYQNFHANRNYDCSFRTRKYGPARPERKEKRRRIIICGSKPQANKKISFFLVCVKYKGGNTPLAAEVDFGYNKFIGNQMKNKEGLQT